MRGKLTPTTAARRKKQLDRFLSHLAGCGSVLESAKKAKLTREYVYSQRRQDPEFMARMEEALDLSADVLEDEATRRAVVGVSDPVYHLGRVVGSVQKYSDTLLIFLLKGRRPERFRDRQSMELTGKGGAALQLPGVIQIQLVSPAREK